jgi:YbgC/YbaW family acyl-CoA thioester hydrolase
MAVISEYSLHRRVHFYETDAAGIVHFSTFFRYLEEAEHALWRAAGISIAERDAAIGWPRVSASFEYLRPLRFEQEFEILIRIAEIGLKKIRYDCVITSAGEKVAAGKMTIVCVTRRPNEPMKSAPIPANIASRFQVATTGSLDS